MTTKDFKRLVRERMAKTGESYSIARMHLMRQQPPGSVPPTVLPPSPRLTADDLWSNLQFAGEDVTYDVLRTINERLVDVVHSGEYSVGYTELEDLTFRRLDIARGSAEFHVAFTAEHPRGDFTFDGYVEGSIQFENAAATKDEFLASISVRAKDPHFNMD